MFPESHPPPADVPASQRLLVQTGICRISHVKMTRKTLAVLQAFLDAGPNGRLYGFEIMQAASVLSGTLYPMLDRFEEADWIVGEWEEPAPEGRPRRRYYRLTGEGSAQANLALVRASGESNASRSRGRYGPVTA
jgi:PadR family transcriptional regulator, regulatory protein PadR